MKLSSALFDLGLVLVYSFISFCLPDFEWIIIGTVMYPKSPESQANVSCTCDEGVEATLGLMMRKWADGGPGQR